MIYRLLLEYVHGCNFDIIILRMKEFCFPILEVKADTATQRKNQ